MSLLLTSTDTPPTAEQLWGETEAALEAPALTRRTRKVTELATEVPVTEGRLPEPEVRAAEEEPHMSAELRDPGAPSGHVLGGIMATRSEWRRYKEWMRRQDEIVWIEQRTMYEYE